jgi:Tfp pilus assembly protein PilZ
MTITERRACPRIRVRWPVTVVSGSAIVQAETRNITVNGVFISSKELLRLDETVPLRINPPNRQPLEVTGKVIWTNHSGVDNQEMSYGIGICFVEVSDGDRHFLEDLISALPR